MSYTSSDHILASFYSFEELQGFLNYWESDLQYVSKEYEDLKLWKKYPTLYEFPTWVYVKSQADDLTRAIRLKQKVYPSYVRYKE